MLQLQLLRAYHPEGCNGKLLLNGMEICKTIELPWRNNRRNISCIPPGTYRLVRRMHHKHGDQIAVANVPRREGILIHPANFALHELQGCIAPVTRFTGPGRGDYSRHALERLKALVYPALEAGETVWLAIR